MIVAATDTSAVTNDWAMAEVIKHPRVLKKIQEELDIVVGSGRMVSESDLIHLKPERHLPNDDITRVEISHGPDFKILPFSAGKRKCSGAPLGVKLVLMALARLFHCYDWSPPDGVRHEDIGTNEVYGMTMPKATPLMAVAKPRLPAHLYH
ncbi:hypothetical protein K7X08_016554 [Anisodus acutangulus]|uniref:Cytochrome P450 n=1 Tax=Anisodus acutangulus TaxID=402998 RepID=A0A9Q1R054_9SOLA|nr:hypothetical protein K7X08_016554 [Anisodus acutangulus]